MKQKINLSLLSLTLALLAMSFASLQAAYLTNVPVKVSQPDGQVLNLFASGDEYYNWLHDKNGFTIMQDPGNGYYVYALKVSGDLVPSSLLPGKDVDPEVFGLQKQALTDPERRPAPEDIFHKPAIIVNAPHSGTLNNIVIFIRFSDESEFTDSISSYNSLFNTATAGANSMRNYFYEVSYNALTIPSTFYPTPGTTVISFQDSQPRNYYQPYNATTNPGGYTSDRTAREHNLLKRAVDYVNGLGQFPSGASIDSDGDGYVDNICFIVSGTPGAWSSLLWPHRWSLYSVSAYIDGKRVYDYNFQLQTATLSWGVGVLSHEMFHSLGSPDLYHYTDNGIAPVGGWDVMEDNANPPQHMLTHMKWKYGKWLSAVPQITASGTYTLNPTTSATNNCYKIASPNSATQYFMVEYRKRTSTFENSIPGEGLLVYRINTAATGNASGPPDEVYIYRPNGTNSVNGTVSQANFSANAGRTAINDTTNPSSFLSDGTAGGLNISNVTAADSTISFDYDNSIVTPSLTVTAPAAAALWEKGRTHTIAWLKQGIQSANVKIMLYKGTANLVKIIVASTANNGAFDWLVPTTLAVGNTYFIRVKTADNSLFDDSGKFSIIVPGITVTAPTSGTVWVKDTTKTITWNKLGTQDANVKIQLYKGTIKKLDITLSAPNNGAYDWLIPSTLANGTNYSIRITTLDGKVKGISKKFSIVTGFIRITQPTTGTSWQRGVAHTITWTREGTLNANVKIQLRKGTNLSIIIDTTPNNGSFEWTIPADKALAANYKIRVTTVDNLVRGESAAFAITQ